MRSVVRGQWQVLQRDPASCAPRGAGVKTPVHARSLQEAILPKACLGEGEGEGVGVGEGEGEGER